MRIQKQTIKNKLGEVTFRRKLRDQFDGKRIFYEGQPTDAEYKKIVKNRLSGYKKDFDNLKSKGVSFKNSFEFGAGVGQASLYLVNKYGGRGIMSDLSLETLSLAPKFLKLLKYKKMPKRVVCDAYHLPFKDNSLSFVFCYETLHHFPSPMPILKEVNRVLIPGGYFFFGGEPIAQSININLWRRDRHLRWWEKILKAVVILHFISRIGKSEVENNILEETFDLNTWRKALDIFKTVEVTLSVFPFNYTIEREKNENKNWLYPSPIKKFFLEFFGGGISAICKKSIDAKDKYLLNNKGKFTCPSCIKGSTLKQKDKTLICPNCKTKYPKKNNILVLLPKNELTLLYSENNN